MNPDEIANAIAISGTAFNALRVTRTGSLSHWKGLAYPNTAFGCTHAAFLARKGITGPAEVFEGNKGFMDSIAGPFTINWKEEVIDRIESTILKKFNAEVHSQSAIEGILEMKTMHGFEASDILRVEIDTFDVAFHIIGGGEEGDKTIVHTKEEADHSLQYMISAAILDGRVMPEQYDPERILREDIQELLRKVTVRPDASFSTRFPSEMPCRLVVHLHEREPKPRTQGITEIRGPYYTPMGRRYLEDLLETMGIYVDSLKFAAGSFSLMPRKAVRELIDICHSHDVLVSTGGFIEHVLTKGPELVNVYIDECQSLGFDIMEL